MTSPGFNFADTLDMDLVLNDGVLSGAVNKTLTVGPFPEPMKITAVSDIYDLDRGASMFVRVTKKLWLYLVQKPTNQVFLYAVDGEKAELSSDNVSSYGGISWMTTLAKFHEKKAIMAVFTYDGLGYTRVEATEKA